MIMIVSGVPNPDSKKMIKFTKAQKKVSCAEDNTVGKFGVMSRKWSRVTLGRYRYAGWYRSGSCHTHCSRPVCSDALFSQLIRSVSGLTAGIKFGPERSRELTTVVCARVRCDLLSSVRVNYLRHMEVIPR